MAEDPDGYQTEAFQMDLSFLDFHAIPVRFYKLLNLDHVTQMDEQKLRDVIAYANEILGRQTNVYIYPVEEDGIILQPFAYTDGDLGDPILEHWVGGTDGVEDIWDQMAPSTNLENIKVIFVWNEEVEESVGVTYYPGTGKYCLITLIDTQPEDNVFDGSVSYIAKILVHELGHWFSKTCILWQRGFGSCTHGDQHFRHGTTCETGDFQFSGNIMTSEPRKLWITKEQASVYNTYAHEALI
jgi:hypothetical protein